MTRKGQVYRFVIEKFKELIYCLKLQNMHLSIGEQVDIMETKNLFVDKQSKTYEKYYRD